MDEPTWRICVGKAHRVMNIDELTCPSPATSLWATGLVPHLDSTVKLTQMIGVQVSWPKSKSIGELAPPLIYHLSGVQG